MINSNVRSCLVVTSILVAFAAVGCSAAESDPLQRSRGGEGSEPASDQESADGTSASGTPSGNRGIIGGTAAAGDPAVVGVVAYTNGGKTQSTCTGEVISATVVLTAAHCVDARALGFVPEGIIIVTHPDFSKAGPADQLRTKAGISHPKYDPQNLLNDIAVVLLEKPTAIAPLPYNRTAIEGQDGKTARIIGYGTTKDGDSSTSGKKNQATVKISQIKPFDFVAATLPVTQCHGDSGGPVLLSMNGKETIIGIGWRTVRNDGLCSEGVRDTRVDKYLDFIDTYVKAGAPAPAPAPAPTPGGTTSSVCCYNGQSFSCPTQADCLGGFDLNACLAACKDTACTIACTNKLSGAQPTAQCTRSAATDGQCR